MQKSSMMASGDGAADRRGRCLHDLERGRQEGDFIGVPALSSPERITVCSGRAAGTVLADLMDASLETMQGGIAAAGA